MSEVPLDEITEIDCGDFTAYNCDNCGAHSNESAKGIKHYPACKPGDSKYWIKFYERAAKESDNEVSF